MGPWYDRISALIRRNTRELTLRLSLCHVSTQWGGACLQAKRRTLTRNWISQQLHLVLPASEIMRNTFLLFKPPSLYICYGGQSSLIQIWWNHHADPDKTISGMPERCLNLNAVMAGSHFWFLSRRLVKAKWNYRKISKVIGMSRLGWTDSGGRWDRRGREKDRERIGISCSVRL